MNRPRPVVTAAGIAGLIHAAAAVIAFLGFAHVSTNLTNAAEAIGAAVIGVVTVAAHLVAAFKAQDQVTPLSDPRDLLGRSLVAVESVAGELQPLFGQVAEIGRELTVPGDGSAHGDLATPVEPGAA